MADPPLTPEALVQAEELIREWFSSGVSLANGDDETGLEDLANRFARALTEQARAHAA